MSVTVRAAWITASAMVLSAAIAVLANFYPARAPEKSPNHAPPLSSVLLDLPAGSSVVIKVVKKDGDGVEEYEASVQRTITEDSQLKLIKNPVIESIKEADLGSIAMSADEAVGRALSKVDFLLLFDAESHLMRVVNARSGEIELTSEVRVDAAAESGKSS